MESSKHVSALPKAWIHPISVQADIASLHAHLDARVGSTVHDQALLWKSLVFHGFRFQ